jgi:hypothetical protein
VPLVDQFQLARSRKTGHVQIDEPDGARRFIADRYFERPVRMAVHQRPRVADPVEAWLRIIGGDPVPDVVERPNTTVEQKLRFDRDDR